LTVQISGRGHCHNSAGGTGRGQRKTAGAAQDLNRLLPLVKWLLGDPHNIVLSAPTPVPSQP